MRSSIHTLFACALALSGVLAAGCDEPMNGGDGGTQTGTDGSTSTQDGGTTTDTDGGGDDTDGGTTPTGDCASQATAFCTRYEECDSNRFIGAYENMSICVEVTTAACETPSAAAPRPTDPATCAAARAGSCAAILGFAGEMPAACLPGPGDRNRDQACGYDSQCGMEGDARLYCRGVTNPACEDGNCYQPTFNGSSCNDSVFDPCDTLAGYSCVHSFAQREMMGTPAWNQQKCEMVQYGAAGADCFEDTEKQCGFGLICMNETCMPTAPEGATCNPSASLCETGLACIIRDDESSERCTRTSIFVQVGAESGTVDGIRQDCSAYAIPSTESPPRCELRRRLDETCSASRSNCWPGLECRGGTCQEPDPATCD